MVSRNVAVGLSATAIIGGGLLLLSRRGNAEEEAIPLGQVGSGNPFLDALGFNQPQGGGEPNNVFNFSTPEAPESFFTDDNILNPSVIEGDASFTQETADFLGEQGFNEREVFQTTGRVPDAGERLGFLIDQVAPPKKTVSDPSQLPTIIGFDNLRQSIVADEKISSEERQGFFNFFTQQTGQPLDFTTGGFEASATRQEQEALLQRALRDRATINGNFLVANQADKRFRRQAEGATRAREKQADRSKKNTSRKRMSGEEAINTISNIPASDVGVVSSDVRNALQRDRLASLTRQMARNENAESKKSEA